MLEKFVCKICQTEFHQDMSTKPYAQCPVCFTYTVYPVAIKELYQKIADNPELQKIYKDILGEGKDKPDATKTPSSGKDEIKDKKKGHFRGFQWIPGEEESK